MSTGRATALNFVAAALHGAQAIAVYAIISWMETQSRSQMLFFGGRFDLVRVAPVWRKNTIESLVLASGQIDVMYVIFAFFLLSAVFQCCGAMFPGPTRYLRFVEYSFSASIMMMAIALEAGIRDLYTLQSMFMLTWATQVFGIVAEILNHIAVRKWITESCGTVAAVGFRQAYHTHRVPKQKEENAAAELLWAWVLPHIAGWGTCMSAYGPAIDVYLQSSSRSERKPPGFVTALVFIELILFSCFGLVQTYALISKTLVCTSSTNCDLEENGINVVNPSNDPNFLQQTWVNYEQNSFSGKRHLDAIGYPKKSLDDKVDAIEMRSEYAFIILSLVAKTLLGWIIISPLIINAADQQ